MLLHPVGERAVQQKTEGDPYNIQGRHFRFNGSQVQYQSLYRSQYITRYHTRSNPGGGNRARTMSGLFDQVNLFRDFCTLKII
jgi:hypothetical protein